MPKYKAGYDEDAIRRESTRTNVSGRSQQDNLRIEEAAQRKVAESSKWMLARRHNMGSGDTRKDLETLGFKILGEADDLFYEVPPPAGWVKETNGYWTTVRDADGNERISQFYKGAWYDRDAFLGIR